MDDLTLSRRAVTRALATLPAIAVPSALAAQSRVGATGDEAMNMMTDIKPNNADAAIKAAWDRRQAAFDTFNTLPFDKPEKGEIYTPQEKRQWDIIDEAEQIIHSTVAKTPEGIAIQIWTGLHIVETSREMEEILLLRDMDALEKIDHDQDWNVRLMTSALRSLRSMGGTA